MTDFDFDAFLDAYEPLIEEVRIGVPNELRSKHARLDRLMRNAAMKDETDKAREYARQVVEVQEEMDQTGQLFTFRAVTPERWADLIREHPPTEEQAAQNKALDRNPETFPVAITAESSLSPRLTFEQLQRARSVMGLGDYDRLVNTAATVNMEVSAAPKSLLATDLLQMNGDSSTTAAPAGSRRRSSSAANGSRSRSASTTKPAG